MHTLITGFEVSNIYKKKLSSFFFLSFVVTFLIFWFLLSFGQNLPSSAQKSVSFLLKQFSTAQCFSRSVCAWLPPHIFFKTWFEVAIYCLPFDGLLSICALLQKARKRTKSVNQTIFTFSLEPNWPLSTRRNFEKKKEERGNRLKWTSWRSCSARLRVYKKKTFFFFFFFFLSFFLSSSSSLFWFFYFCSVLVRTFPLLHRKPFLSF